MLLSPAGVDALRTALTRATFTANGIAERLGPQTTGAVARNDFRAALRATEERDPLATLIRVFICDQTESEATVAAALAPLTVEEALAGGSSSGTATACAPASTWSRTGTTGGYSPTCRPAPAPAARCTPSTFWASAGPPRR